MPGSLEKVLLDLAGQFVHRAGVGSRRRPVSVNEKLRWVRPSSPVPTAPSSVAIC